MTTKAPSRRRHRRYGRGSDGRPTDQYQPGIELHSKYVFFAEGCRGHLGRQLMERYR